MKIFGNAIKTAKVVAKNSQNECKGLEIHETITKVWTMELAEEAKYLKNAFDRETAEYAADGHDKGKRFVWEDIISSAKADDAMRARINTHSITGAIMIFKKALKDGKSLKFAIRVAKIVLCHHDYITGVGVNGLKVSDKITQTLTIADIIAARCYDDPTRNYPVELTTPVELAKDLSKSANFNKEVLAKVEVVYSRVSKILAEEYGIYTTAKA